MPLKKITFKPGINRDQTNYANEGGWFAGNKVRFLSGFPQKIGGWARWTTSAFIGVCRSMFAWATTGAYNFMALGTNSYVYVESGGTIHDISPIQKSYVSPASNNCLAVVSGSATLTITAVGNNAQIGDRVIISGATDFGGINAATYINKEHTVVTASSGSVTVTLGTTATSTVASGGGTSIVVDFILSPGNEINVLGYGWGAPPWGGPPGWGLAATIPINIMLRLVHFDKNGADLVFNVRGGDIYYWTLDTSFSTRAVKLSDLPNATPAPDFPTEVTQVMIDDASGVLLAFGCTPFGGGPTNPLLIRWSSQVETALYPQPILNWIVSDDPGISTSGYLTIQSGARIVCALPSYGETLVFTESSVSSLQFTEDVTQLFSARLISAAISLIGPNAAISVNNIVFWMGTDKFFIYNGRVETLPCTLRQHLFENINLVQSDQVFAASDERYNEVWWFYCSANSNSIDKYIVYNYVEQIWYYGDCSEGMARTAWLDTPLRDYPQAASSDDNYIYNHEVGYDANGVPFTSFIQSSDISLDEGDRFMLLRRLIPDVSFNGSTAGNPAVDFTLLPRNFPGGQVMPSAPTPVPDGDYMTTNQEGQDFSRTVVRSAPTTTISVEQYTAQVFVRGRARQMAFKIESAGMAGVSWQLGIPRLDIRPDGTRG